MNNKHKLFHTLALLLLLTACENEKKESVPAGINNSQVEANVHSEEFDGPPFEEECEAGFHLAGTHKISNGNYNIYYLGKGWEPELYACSFTWGELISNGFPEDTAITGMKIHLLDLDKFVVPSDDSDYGQDSIKSYVIAVYSRDEKTGKYRTMFDPFKTGKYPKPSQWVE